MVLSLGTQDGGGDTKQVRLVPVTGFSDFSGQGVGVVQGQPQLPPPSPYRVRLKDLSSMEGQACISPSVEESRVGQRLRDRGQTFPDVRQSQLSLDLGVSTFLLFLPQPKAPP